MTTETTALILGATGGVGHETAQALLARGWRVRALHRDADRAAATLPGAEWIGGDALNADDVAAAAKGATVLVHAVNPPNYRKWDKLVLPMLDNTIAAAEPGARIVLPGTLYNYGPDVFPLIGEDAPQNPLTRKGKIRAAMERRLKRASTKRDIGVLILRGGDFFGPRTGNSWFSGAMINPGRRVDRVIYPGPPDIGHQWAYLPDFAEAVAQLLDRRDELGAFESFHFGGHWFDRGVEFAEQLTRALDGGHTISIRFFPWGPVRVLSPFVRLFRELAEMRYLWTTAVRLDNARLVSFLGKEPHTPIDAAMKRSLTGQGCLACEQAQKQLMMPAISRWT